MKDKDIIEHVDITKRTQGVRGPAIDAARKAFEDGASPRAQLDAARQTTPQRLGYLPHCGAKQRAKNLKRMEKAAAKVTSSSPYPAIPGEP